MEVKTEIFAVQIPMNQLMMSHKREEVLNYCRNCGNYMKNYSCPDFEFDILEYLSNYNYATVIMTKVDSEFISESIDNEYLKDMSCDSKVLRDYERENPDVDMDLNSKISMFMFNEIKDYMTDKLLDMENYYPNSVSLPPGSCTRCDVCFKKENSKCNAPEKLRYSLEALGFLVSDIYRDIFESELGWAKGKLPESFNTCSAFLTNDIIKVAELKRKIGEIRVEM